MRKKETEYQRDLRLGKRDTFARAALVGMLSSAPMCDRTKIDKDKWARISYLWADAMLKARTRNSR